MRCSKQGRRDVGDGCGIGSAHWLLGVVGATAGLLLACGASQAQQPSAPRAPKPAVPAPAPALVIDGVNVVDVRTGRVEPAQRAVITGNHIRAVGRASGVRRSRGAKVVDGRGKYLIPGLWDMHVHVERDADVFYPLFVAYGVTGVRDAGSVVPLATLSRWKQEIATGARVGPRLVVAGPSVTQCPAATGPGWDHTICVATPSEARLAVDFLKLAGADFIKLHDPMPSRELNLALLAEARRLGIPAGGHFNAVPGQEASDSGVRFLDHQTWFNPNVCGELSDAPAAYNREQCAAAGEQLRRNGTWVVVTPAGWGEQIFPDVYRELWRRYYPDSTDIRLTPFAMHWRAAWDSVFPGAPRHPASFADWQAMVQHRRGWFEEHRVRTHGLPIVAGTDVVAANAVFGVPGYGLHEALVAFVLGGMTPLEALQTATLNPAQALQATDSLGTVEAGKLADLVLLDANPLDDIWNTTKIRAVVANGRYFDRAALDRLLADARRAAH